LAGAIVTDATAVAVARMQAAVFGLDDGLDSLAATRSMA